MQHIIFCKLLGHLWENKSHLKCFISGFKAATKMVAQMIFIQRMRAGHSEKIEKKKTINWGDECATDAEMPSN